MFYWWPVTLRYEANKHATTPSWLIRSDWFIRDINKCELTWLSGARRRSFYRNYADENKLGLVLFGGKLEKAKNNTNSDQLDRVSVTRDRRRFAIQTCRKASVEAACYEAEMEKSYWKMKKPFNGIWWEEIYFVSLIRSKLFLGSYLTLYVSDFACFSSRFSCFSTFYDNIIFKIGSIRDRCQYGLYLNTFAVRSAISCFYWSLFSVVFHILILKTIPSNSGSQTHHKHWV